MGRFRTYDQDQAWLLPPSVKDVLGESHLSLFVHHIVEQLDLRAMEEAYGAEGQPGYHPRLLLKLWLYAYCLGVTSSRRLEQRTREDLGFRYLAGNAQPDHWTLNEFRRRHGRAINDVFTQVLEWAREQGWGRLGHVAIDSTRIAANASVQRLVTVQSLREERARIRRQIRRWQKQCNEQSWQESAGTEIEAQEWRKRLAEIPKQLKRLQRAGVAKQSTTDPDSRFLRARRGFVLGYTADLAVSDDHLILAQRVTQQTNDNASLLPLVQQVQERCGALPERVSADTGFYQTQQLEAVISQGIDVYVPDSNLAHELHAGLDAEQTDGCIRKRSEAVQSMRAKLRSSSGREIYRRRQALVEPVFGVLKEQRQARRFRLRGLAAVGVEFCFVTLAFNLTRLYHLATSLGTS